MSSVHFVLGYRIGEFAIGVGERQTACLENERKPQVQPVLVE
jgi:hypothetical protein